MKEKYRIFSILPSICIMYGIFYFSAQNAIESSGLSEGIIEKVFVLIERTFDMQLDSSIRVARLELFETLVRKAAHMMEYTLLANAIAFPFYLYGRRNLRLVLWSEAVCVLYAATDEFHQVFVSGRSGQLTDVLIDACGALIGCLLFIYLLHKKERIQLKANK